MKQIAEAAKGHWPDILAHFGISLPARGKHGPCPACGGKDRFRFDDKEGRGSFYCSGCGAGDGFYLIRNAKGGSISDAFEKVREYLKIPANNSVAPKTDPTKAMRALWDRARSPVDGGPVRQYLQKRLGPHEPPMSIREAMSVYDPETKQSFPAMIAKIASPENRAVNLHITYLTSDGKKAATPKPKRVMAGKLPEGSAIRLARAEGAMGIAEGIETALAAAKLFDIPVWAAVSGNGLAKWTPPEEATTIYVFADYDENYAGQSKAYTLAHRLITIFKRDVVVEVPDFPGDDWNDVLDMGAVYESRRRLTPPNK